jgi:hypothetical protein
MSPQVILGAIVVVPFIVLMLFRINAALVFMSLCLGAVLVQFVAPDTQSFADLFSAHNLSNAHPPNNTIQLALLLFPVVLTAVFMIRTVRGHTKLLLNALPAAGVGLLGALLVVPLLSLGLQYNIIHSNLWQQLNRGQDLVVGVSALICLLVLWMQRPKTGEGKKSKHKG